MNEELLKQLEGKTYLIRDKERTWCSEGINPIHSRIVTEFPKPTLKEEIKNSEIFEYDKKEEQFDSHTLPLYSYMFCDDKNYVQIVFYDDNDPRTGWVAAEVSTQYSLRELEIITKVLLQ